MEKQKKMSKDTNVKDILSFVSPKQLSNFILEYASGHPECKQALIEKFLPARNTTNKTSLDYRTEIQQCFNVPYRETRRADTEDITDQRLIGTKCPVTWTVI